jgi:hypothetical protein
LIVKDAALSLVGAEVRPITHPENKIKQIKKGKMIILPDSGAHDRVDERGNTLLTPNWSKPAAHPDNQDFIATLTDVVSLNPVGPSSPRIFQADRWHLQTVNNAGYDRDLIKRAAQTYFQTMRTIFRAQGQAQELRRKREYNDWDKENIQK